jgi:hypothetical protein
MTTYDNDLRRLNDILRPIAAPSVLENVYTDDQHERILNVIKEHGPWPSIISLHFDSVEELFATSNPGGEIDPAFADLTLDDVAIAQFRGFFAKDSINFFPELDDCLYNSRFLELARNYWA